MLKKRYCWLILFVVCLTILSLGVGCSSTNQSGDAVEESADGSGNQINQDKPIVISSKTFTENLILGEIAVALLEENGFTVDNEVGLGELNVIRPALESGEIDMYWEYTGTGLIRLMQQEPIDDPDLLYETVKNWDAENNIVWLNYAPGNNSYSLCTWPGFKAEYGVQTISDLTKLIDEKPKEFTFATREEWMERPDGYKVFNETYGFNADNLKLLFLALGLTPDAIKEKKADFSVELSTDGRILAYNLEVIEDDKHVFPIYNPAPVIRKEVLDKYPQIADIMGEVSPMLDTNTLISLNKQVDVDKKEPGTVAREFLKEKGLIK
ncbi:MAG: glycine betaine ABC transporter substrate-binding protein [Dehalobacterium sp.]